MSRSLISLQHLNVSYYVSCLLFDNNKKSRQPTNIILKCRRRVLVLIFSMNVVNRKLLKDYIGDPHWLGQNFAGPCDNKVGQGHP